MNSPTEPTCGGGAKVVGASQDNLRELRAALERLQGEVRGLEALTNEVNPQPPCPTKEEEQPALDTLHEILVGLHMCIHTESTKICKFTSELRRDLYGDG